jgi:endoglucanase
MLSMQDEDGGVWHKQTSEQFCAFVLPERDELTSYVIGTGETPYKSTAATADLAAVMAIAARCFAAYDATFSARCLGAAKRGWSWAVAHPGVTFTNPPGVATGEYGDPHCADEILWASAELWRTTGEQQYERAFQDGVAALPPENSIIEAPSWVHLPQMAHWTYALAERKVSEELRERVVKQTAKVAQGLVGRARVSGYGNTLAAKDYVWGSNSVAANQSLLLLVAHHFQPDRQFVEAALGNLHYLLGRNCFGVSWVTQVGTRPFEHPHHRPSGADGIPAPWPGLMSGGPNARPGDEAPHTLGNLPPMRMWMDDQRAYSLNEVAINWNAPLVFLLAGANALAV